MEPKTKPKISVVIPAYNCKKMLAQAIQSVFIQCYENYEIIVIDDGSTDNTKGYLKKFLKGTDYKSNKVRYVRQNNRGVSAARNNGIKKATGQYIAFLDADDLWLENKLQLQMEFYNKHRNIGLLYNDAVTVDMNNIDILHSYFYFQKYNRIFRGKKAYKKLYNFYNIIPTSSVIVRKEVFKKAGFFDEKLKGHEDLDMWIRIALSYPIDYLDRILSAYRVRRHGNISKDKELMEQNLKIVKDKYKNIIK